MSSNATDVFLIFWDNSEGIVMKKLHQALKTDSAFEITSLSLM